jgi:hypothetical protein
MGEKLGVALYIIYNPVHWAIAMIKIPATSRVHAIFNSMAFFFTVKVVCRWFIDGQKILVLSFLRRIVFIGLPQQVLLLSAL